MANFALVIVCLCLGALFKRLGKMPASTPSVLNAFVIFISLPALTLLKVHELSLEGQVAFPIAMAWVLFVLGAAFFAGLARGFGWDRTVLGALILTGCLGNTSFVGFPLLEALYGPRALATGVLTDQPGTFLVLSTLGILAASLCASKSLTVSAVVRRILGFPPFLALLAALLLRPWGFSPVFTSFLDKLAATLAPLALVSVGFQLELRAKDFAPYGMPLLAGLLYKLILGPALLSLLFIGIYGARGEAIEITLVQSAMAPMITGAIVATEYGLAPELSNLMVSVGIPISLLTTPLWAHLVRHWLG